MKFIVSSSELNKGLKTLSPAIQKNTVIPILESFKVTVKDKKATLYATDLNLSIITVIDVDANEDFECIIPFKTLFNTSSLYKNEPISIEVKESGVSVIVKDKKFGLGGYEKPENFPVFTDIEDGANEIELTDTLLDKIKSAVACVGVDVNSRFRDVSMRVKKGIFDVVATDALIMFVYSEKIDAAVKNAEISVPTYFIRSLNSLMYGKLFIGEKTLKVSFGNTSFVGRLTEQTMPYEAIDNMFPKEDCNCTISKEDLMEMISGVLVFNSKLPIVALSFADGEITFDFEDKDFGEKYNSTIKAIHHSPIENISFNVKQLKTLIDLCDEDEVQFVMPDHASKGAKIISGNLKMLIQPIFYNPVK